MSAFEDLGTGLGSLSLGDLNGTTPFSTHEDDLMEIDSIESYDLTSDHAQDDKNRNNLFEHTAGFGDKTSAKENGVEYMEENLLFLHNLNPTVMGAKYALKPLKLLMPPPPIKDHNLPECDGPLAPSLISSADHDYEFDTSMLTSVGKYRDSSVALRNTDEIRSIGQDAMFSRFPEPSRVSASEPQAPYYDNLMGRPYQYEARADPIQIHHHHYYPQENSFSRVDRRNLLSDDGKNNDFQTSGSLQRVEPVMNAVSKQEHASLSSTSKDMHHTSHLSTWVSADMLPSPWDSRAVPAERTPYVLSSYLQLFVNVILSGYAVHIIVSIIQAIRQDVAQKLNQEASNLLVEMAICERSYHENYCSPNTVVPALEKMCAYWEKCMNQDPFQIGNRSRVSAHTIGVILNSLVEPLSIKFLAVGGASILVVFACNFAFGYIRAKSYYGWSSAGARRI